jgi:hypothetical protein
VFDASGELLKSMGRHRYTGVAMRGGTIFAQVHAMEECVVYT